MTDTKPVDPPDLLKNLPWRHVPNIKSLTGRHWLNRLDYVSVTFNSGAKMTISSGPESVVATLLEPAHGFGAQGTVQTNLTWDSRGNPVLERVIDWIAEVAVRQTR